MLDHSPNGPLASLLTQKHGHQFAQRIRPKRGAISVLSFDGGGCRGYASLLILKKVLRRVQPEGDIFPYLYFDLICGTSTGGLIAILLAVLYLDIETAIQVYTELAETIFKNKWPKTRLWLKDAQFDQSPLRKAISEILTRHGRGRRLMHDKTYNRGCVCFVTATHRQQNSTTNIVIRSDEDQVVPNGYQWTILDAALATSAAPTYFEPHYIRRDANIFQFEDAGAHGINNPAEVALRECERLHMTRFSYFLSIGTGSKGHHFTHGRKEHGKFRRAIKNFFDLHQRVAKHAQNFAREATDVTGVEERMNRKAKQLPKFPYYRFNPPDLGNINLADHTAIPGMELMVNQFFENNEAAINLCVNRIAKVIYKNRSWWRSLRSWASRPLRLTGK